MFKFDFQLMRIPFLWMVPTMEYAFLANLRALASKKKIKSTHAQHD
jgi:hypothetical protein